MVDATKTALDDKVVRRRDIPPLSLVAMVYVMLFCGLIFDRRKTFDCKGRDAAYSSMNAVHPEGQPARLMGACNAPG